LPLPASVPSVFLLPPPDPWTLFPIPYPLYATFAFLLRNSLFDIRYSLCPLCAFRLPSSASRPLDPVPYTLSSICYFRLFTSKFVIRYSLFPLPLCAFCLLSSAFCLLSSVFRPLSSVFCLPPPAPRFLIS
jgi:hypothetical protein